jgi:hypothetical protein
MRGKQGFGVSTERAATGVGIGQGLKRPFWVSYLIEVVLKDGLDRSIADVLEEQSPSTGRL